MRLRPGLCLNVSGVALACWVAVASAAAPAPSTPQGVFLRACAGCHGPRGEGGRGPTLAIPLTRARDRKALVKLLKDGIDGTEMPPARLPAAEVGALADWVLALSRRPPERVPGDPQRGQALYFARGGCPVCHAIGGHGGGFGTDLTDIGRRRGAAHLRQALVEPEGAVPTSSSPYRADVSLAQNFLQVRVRTKAGEEVRGVRINEDSFSIQLREVSNRVRSFWKADLVELDKQWGRSPMPSYQETLSPAELDDLVAFLLSLRGDQAP
jgi:cytochrome c oxidase cbb3-type subunit III